MKEFVLKLSENLFKTKLEIEKELSEGNKTNEDLYLLILKAIEFLKAKRKGEDLWNWANERELPKFVKYIEKAHKSLQDNSLILDKKDYEDLKKILDQFWYYKVGKMRLIEMDNKKI